MLTTESLKALSDLVKIAPLAERAGLNVNTLKTRLSRGGELTEEERRSLTEALRALRDDITRALR